MKDNPLTGFGLGAAVLAAFLLLPPAEPLTPLGMRVIGIFLATVVWWVTVGLGYPSFLCIALLAMTGVMTPTEIYAKSMGHWVVLFMIGCFGLTEGLKATGALHRFTLWFMTRSFASGRPWMMVAMLLLACTILGSFISITATCILFMSIAASLLDAAGYHKGDRFASTLMMGIAWASTAASAITPVGFVGNVMVIEWIKADYGYQIGFPQWMIFGVPTGLLTYLAIMGVFRYIIRPDITRIAKTSTEYTREMRAKLGPLKAEEKAASAIFLAVVVCWMTPSLVGDMWPQASAYLNAMGYAVPAVLGSCLLCVTHVKGRPLLTFQQWMLGVEWVTVPLTAVIMALGVILGLPETGIMSMLTGTFEPMVAGMPFTVMLVFTLLWLVVQTNVMSNMLSMTLVYTIVLPVAASAGMGNPAALGATIAAAANYAFALPSATTSTALVVGSGWVPVDQMARYGAMMIVPTILIFAFFCYPLAAMILL